MQEFLRFIGHGFCHQIPSRSFEAGGLVFSVCARDTGIYLGLIFTVLVAFILYSRLGRKPGDLPPTFYLVALVFMALPMAIDGGTSYLGLRETNNTIRYLTGFGMGISCGSLIAPLLFAMRKDADLTQKIFSKPSHIALQLTFTLILGIAFLIFYPYLGIFSPLLAALAFIGIILSVNLILLTLTKRFTPHHTLNHWLLLIVLSLALSFIEIAAFAAARDLMVNLALNGRDIFTLIP